MPLRFFCSPWAKWLMKQATCFIFLFCMGWFFVCFFILAIFLSLLFATCKRLMPFVGLSSTHLLWFFYSSHILILCLCLNEWMNEYKTSKRVWYEIWQLWQIDRRHSSGRWWSQQHAETDLCSCVYWKQDGLKKSSTWRTNVWQWEGKYKIGNYVYANACLLTCMAKIKHFSIFAARCT